MKNLYFIVMDITFRCDR